MAPMSTASTAAPYVVAHTRVLASHFQGDLGVVGRTVQINKHPFTIAGVARRFHGTLLFFSPDFFITIVTGTGAGVNVLNSRGNKMGVFCGDGHLKAGVTAAQATAILTRLARISKKPIQRRWPCETLDWPLQVCTETFLGLRCGHSLLD